MSENIQLFKDYYDRRIARGHRLPKIVQEKWLLAEREVEKSYVFDVRANPWEIDLESDSEFANVLGQRVAPPKGDFYRNRVLGLLTKSDVSFEQRYTDAVYGTSNPWGVLAMAVLRGTFRSMTSLKQSDLVSQEYLLGKEFGICGIMKGASRSALMKVLKENSEEYLDGRHNPFRVFQTCIPEYKTNTKKLFYSRVYTRAVFSVRFVLDEANWVASDIFHQATGWMDRKAYWRDGLNHDYELIDVCLNQLETFYSTSARAFPKKS